MDHQERAIAERALVHGLASADINRTWFCHDDKFGIALKFDKDGQRRRLGVRYEPNEDAEREAFKALAKWASEQ